MPKPYVVERSTVIAAPADAIYPRLVDFHRWIDWSPWEGLDSNLKRTYSGPESGVGATYAWSGNRRAGRGTQTITSTTEPTEVRVDLTFEKPFPAKSKIAFILTPEGDATKVVWRMTGEVAGFLSLFAGLMPMEKFVGPDFEKGLAKLKTVSESAS